jgi:4-hydroxy-tetrahydrodipicolinate reductase
MAIRVCIAGVTGWVGEPLTTAIAECIDLELVGAIARSAEGQCVNGVRICASVEEALQEPSDVFVDYTSAGTVKENVTRAIVARRNVVIGSSGLTDEDFVELDHLAHANQVGVIAVGNFAISALLLQQFAVAAAQYLPSWEIIDIASDKKIDAPSGTARELAWRLGQTAQPPSSRVAASETVGVPSSRGASLHQIQVHSIRLPGHVIGLEILFGSEHERLSIKCECGASAKPYIDGTIRAIREVMNVRGVHRGMPSMR